MVLAVRSDEGYDDNVTFAALERVHGGHLDSGERADLQNSRCSACNMGQAMHPLHAVGYVTLEQGCLGRVEGNDPDLDGRWRCCSSRARTINQEQKQVTDNLASHPGLLAVAEAGTA